MALSVRSERALEQVVLFASNPNIDGDQVITHGLPAGFGDCLLISVQLEVSAIATLVADPTVIGVEAFLVTPGSSIQCPAGVGSWKRTQAASLASTIEVEQVLFWREQELLYLVFPELDTNATPTADLSTIVLVRRLRQLGPSHRPEFRLTS